MPDPQLPLYKILDDAAIFYDQISGSLKLWWGNFTSMLHSESLIDWGLMSLRKHTLLLRWHDSSELDPVDSHSLCVLPTPTLHHESDGEGANETTGI